jgi:hypothetical protein
MFYYVGFMAAGDVADYLIGLVVERLWPQASLSRLSRAVFCVSVDCLAAGGADHPSGRRRAGGALILPPRSSLDPACTFCHGRIVRP